MSSGFLWFNVLATTALCVLAGLAALFAPGLRRQHVDPEYIENALTLLVGGAVAKLVTFAACVWPSRCGCGPLGREEWSASGHGDGSPLVRACACGSVWLVRRYVAAGAAMLRFVHSGRSGGGARRAGLAAAYHVAVR